MPSASSLTCSFSVQLSGLDDAALELVARAVGIDHQAGIGDAPDAIDLHRLLHGDGGDHGGIGGAVLVAGEGQAEALAGAGRPARRPAGALGHPLDQPPRPRLGQDRQAIGDRDPRRRAPPARRSAIRWRRRWAARPARAAPRCAPAGAARDDAGCDAPARRRAARRCACRRRRALPADRTARPRAADWPAPRTPADSRCRCPGRWTWVGAPDLRRPVGRPAALVEIDMQGHQHGRADRLEAELLLAAPLQADPAAGNAHGDQRGVEGGIVGAVVAVAAGAMQVLRGDRLDRQAEHRRRGSCAADACPGRASAPSDARRGTRPARRTATSRHARCRAARR